MSCLPLLSFTPSISSVFRPYVPPLVLKQNEQLPPTPNDSPTGLEEMDSPYDKLSQVSVSHRRVDSFEWVMTRSAPNTPPTLGGPNYEPFSPAPARLIGSAPLPVPNEDWSVVIRPDGENARRGYFDWWTSPSLSNNKGYARVSEVETQSEQNLQASPRNSRKLITGRSKPSLHAQYVPVKRNEELRPSQELNALGIVLPCTPPSSPPAPAHSRALRHDGPLDIPTRTSAPRLPKKVSFSPIIDEVMLETSSELNSPGEQPMFWGNYLPSSFLVARPPLPRTTSSPMPRGRTAIRPILRHSVSLSNQLVHGIDPGTEMKDLSSRANDHPEHCKPSESSLMPTSRLSALNMRGDEHRRVVEDTDEMDRAFVSLLQTASKSAPRRCDSVHSAASSDSDGRTISF